MKWCFCFGSNLSELLEGVGAARGPIADCVAGDGHQPRRPSLLRHRVRIEPRFSALRRRKVPRKIAGVPVSVSVPVPLPLTNPNGIIIASVGSSAALFTPATALGSGTGRLAEHATHPSVVAASGGGGRRARKTHGIGEKSGDSGELRFGNRRRARRLRRQVRMVLGRGKKPARKKA